MIKTKKTDISKEQVLYLHKKYGLSPLEASIFARKGITKGSDILYYLENDRRFLHQPFLFSSMEDAVERITDAIDEGEKVLIFGDKDVDGITSTAILYGFLKKTGLDVQWRLPVGEDSYGLSMEAVDDFAKDYGSLIITVDCGISCVQEIAHANELGIDVIVTDHHNPPEILPEAAVFLDPKLQDSGYPFKDISGAAVAYKLVSAIRFSRSDFYNQDICLIHAEETKNNTVLIECLKTRNLVRKELFSQEFKTGSSISNTKLPDFLRGQQLFAWNAKKTNSALKAVFGNAVEFQMMDIQTEIAKKIPQVKDKTLSEIKNLSKTAKYSEEEVSDITSFYNIFVTFAELSFIRHFPNFDADSIQDLQLVGIAALADIMPMKNENRIFVKTALEAINSSKIRKGISDLTARMDLAGKNISSTDLSWKLIPALNAAGRMGMSNLSLELLIAEDAQERSKLAGKIIELNEERKKLVNEAEFYTSGQALENFEKFNKTLCIVIDERINRGITGILAAKIMGKYKVPSIAVTISKENSIAIGSMRSCRSVIATKFLEQFGEGFFLNYGGHDAAAGFSFETAKIPQFIEKAEELSKNLNLQQEDESVEISAELPGQYITSEIIKTVELFEPYGEQNPELVFYSQNLKIFDGTTLGKSEKQHLKLTFDCGNCKFPAIFWGEGERLNRDFKKGDNITILYKIEKNTFNGAVTPQMILMDIQK